MPKPQSATNGFSAIPLAERVRPRTLTEFIGQEDVVGSGKIMRTLIEQDELPSLILWGPPGVGKTTLALVVANESKAEFVSLSAVMDGKERLKRVIEQAKQKLEKQGIRTVLFIDEIHRWNKAQQDALLPYVEKGVVTLIGATTENPSFVIIGALLSRCRVIILRYLSIDQLMKVLRRALADEERGLGKEKIFVPDAALRRLAELSGGDARVALNGLEIAVGAHKHGRRELSEADMAEAVGRTHLVFDKRGEEFYNLISALHKSMRGSDPDAALYWLARMLEGGADPLYVARRVLRFASEDIGMANAEALVQANAAYDAVHKIGYPECSVHLAQAVVYCAKSAKSNVLYRAYAAAAEDARATSHFGVPLHLRNAPTTLMKELGYGKGYKYNPDYDGGVEQDYFPSELKNRKYIKK